MNPFYKSQSSLRMTHCSPMHWSELPRIDCWRLDGRIQPSRSSIGLDGRVRGVDYSIIECARGDTRRRVHGPTDARCLQ